jgi:hypothetical protein
MIMFVIVKSILKEKDRVQKGSMKKVKREKSKNIMIKKGINLNGSQENR